MTDLRRRIDNLLRIGTVSEVDLDRARVRVHYGAGRSGDGVEAQTALLPWMTTRAGADRTWWAPSVGEQVMILSPSGDLAAGVALPAIFSAAGPPPAAEDTQAVLAFADGAVISYDASSHTLRAALPAGGKLAVDGGVEDAAGPMSEMRRIFNLHTHPALGATPNVRM